MRRVLRILPSNEITLQHFRASFKAQRTKDVQWYWPEYFLTATRNKSWSRFHFFYYFFSFVKIVFEQPVALQSVANISIPSRNLLLLPSIKDKQFFFFFLISHNTRFRACQSCTQAYIQVATPKQRRRSGRHLRDPERLWGVVLPIPRIIGVVCLSVRE